MRQRAHDRRRPLFVVSAHAAPGRLAPRSVAALVVVLAVGMAGLSAATPASAKRVAAAPAASDRATAPVSEAAASTRARATGRPVVVDSETTATSQVVAEADGTFTLTTSREPVRVKDGDGWIPIDTDLHAGTDGTVAPRATSESMTFSGGGSGPAVTVRRGGESLSFSWPSTLPSPSLDGPTATYANVLPGVDLTLTAHPESFTEVLVVHDAEAAANPALAGLHFTTTAVGLDVASDATGALTATDAAGTVAFAGSRPVMWDSHVDPTDGTAPSAVDPAGGRITALGLRLPTLPAATGSAEGALSLFVPPQALTGPDVVYPLYIDPSVADSVDQYYVLSDDSGEYYRNAGDQLKIGSCPVSSGQCGGSTFQTRSFFDLKVANLGGRATTAHIYSADVAVYEKHSASGCTPEPVDLYTSGAVSDSTRWPGPGGDFLERLSSARGDNCSSAPAGDIDFDSSDVVDYVQKAANSDADYLWFSLRAPTDSSQAQWKRFDATPTVTVHYAFPPSTPGSLNVSSKVACSGKPVYTSDTNPKLYASAKDNNPSPLSVNLFFSMADTSGKNTRTNATGITKASGVLGEWTVSSAVPPGSYRFSVSATSDSSETPQQRSATSGSYAFTVDPTPPVTPSISSFDYPAGAWGAPQAQRGTFTLASTSTDTAGFAYAFDTSTVPSVAATTCSYTGTGLADATSGTASITAPNLAPGPHTLYVKAFDDAHNTTSTPVSYSFYVAPTVSGEGPTKLEAEGLPATEPGCDAADAALACGGRATDPTYVESSTRWSGGGEEHLVVPAADPTASPAPPALTTPQDFTFSINTPVSGDYALGVALTTQYHFGILDFKIDGRQVVLNGEPLHSTDSQGHQVQGIDTYSPSVDSRYVQLGGVGPTPDPNNPGKTITRHTITVSVIGKDPAAKDYVYNGDYGGQTLTGVHSGGYSAAIDFFTAVPIDQAAFTSLTAAMNNRGVAVDNTTSANIGPSTARSSLSSSTLASASTPTGTQDLRAGATPVFDGVTFTMPSANASGDDNVIADGQTVNLPAPVVAHNIELLATTTCSQAPTHASPANPTVRLGVNYNDGTYDDHAFPSVPEWSYGVSIPAGTPGITDAATFSQYDLGGIPNTGVKPRIYHISIPTGRTDVPVTSVVLPNFGSSFTNGCKIANLHVLALTTS